MNPSGSATDAGPRHRVLVVDDDIGIRHALVRMMQRFGHDVVEAADGEQALENLDDAVDLVLLDVNMPGLGGFEVVERLRRDPRRRDVPIMMVTGQDDEPNWRRALDVGASDFIGKPVDMVELELRSAWLLTMKTASDELRAHREHLEQLVEQRTAALQHALDETAHAQQRTWEAHLDTVRRLVLAAEYRDSDTAAHIERIGRYSGMLAEMQGLDAAEVRMIGLAAPMHDVGKIGIPDYILLKRGPLDASEWQVMRTHPTIGAHILEGSPSEIVQAGRVIALGHHEHWDGGGYPNGVSGTAIPLHARICAVADVFDALTTDRPYRARLPFAEVFDLMEADRGRQFDPAVVDVFLQHRDVFVTTSEALTGRTQGASA
jgi:cyclic di-GMP phosphodiesterase